MPTEVRVPALPESVADATVLTWHFQPGDRVRRDDNLVDLETDKVVLEVPAPADGVLADAAVAEGDIVTADSVLGHIEAQQEGAASEAAAPAQTASAPAPAPAPQTTQPTSQHTNDRKQKASAPEPAKHPGTGPKAAGEPAVAPAARRLIKEMGLDPTRIPGSGKGGRITKADVIAWLDEQEAAEPAIDPDAAAAARSAPDAEPPEHGVLQPPGLTGEAGRPEQRVRMTRLRARIAERLVDAQKTTAMLTTFNEVDMEAVLALRRQYKEQFEKTHNVRLGLMSFFVKAAVEALQRFPIINASVDGDDIIYHGYYDIGIAVSADRGLVVPILRNCDQLSMADVERGIVDFATKAKDGSLSFEELTGGTFSITNGGVFGSLLSTPILNLPQSAILGMHSIQERPVAVDGEIVIRPMMYLALSYDHRIVDGREAVQFLMTIKQTLEDPARLLLRI